ncbi:MAG: type IV pilus assembly protein PilM [Phycisphaerae bacterium]|nr:type IV pilus assembly protein PilM [Phycisphaerae bacterium]
MATVNSVWGIDIGQCALKALKLRDADGVLQVEALDIIEHAQILSEPDADRVQLVRTALETFLSRNAVAGSLVAVAVSGQSGFTRFVKLPPVESKKIPDIVRFEAEQQIPFPIADVIWRWQPFQDTHSPDVEVGIFAMKRVDVAEMLDHFDEVQLAVDVVQMAPLALFNFLTFDEQLATDGATLLADVGANKTDLVVADGPRIWTRTIQIGGNDFTESLVKAFKLSFPKAEKLKRSAATSKYARQIFQAMRPVFSDLAQEIQRSVGYYTAMRREARFKKVVGLGNGFRLPGLQKFLEQQLNIPVVRVDTYNKLTGSGTVNAPMLNENVLSFAVAYGLALQGLELSAVGTNLLPDEIARRRLWGRKRPWFAATGAVLLAALAAPLYRAVNDRSALAQGEPYRDADRITRTLREWSNRYEEMVGRAGSEAEPIDRYRKLFGYRAFWPAFQAVLSTGIEASFACQKLYNEYSAATNAQTRERIKGLIRSRYPTRANRPVVFLQLMQAAPLSSIQGKTAETMLRTGAPGETYGGSGSTLGGAASEGGKPGYYIRIVGRTSLDQRQANPVLTNLRKELEKAAKDVPSLNIVGYAHNFISASSVTGGAMASGMRRGYTYEDERDYDQGPRSRARRPGGPMEPDPLFPEEEGAGDVYFQIGLIVAIEGDGVTEPNVPVGP